MSAPLIHIYVRHSADCPYQGDESWKRCACWKWLRWRRDGKLYRQATKSKTWAGAERAKRERELKFENAAKGTVSHSPLTVEEAAALYIKNKQDQGLEAVTIKKNTRTAQRLLDFCNQRGKLLLAEITAADLVEYRNTWQQWFRSTMVRSCEQTRLKSFFRCCHAQGIIPKDPASEMSPIKVEREPTLPFEPKEMSAILAAIPDCEFTSRQATRIRGLILLMRWSGLSIIDAVGLDRENVRFVDGEYRVVTRRRKTGVLINNVVPKWVGEELKAVANGNPRYIFWNGGSETPRSAAGRFTKLLQKVFEKANIPDGHPHRFRDTAAVELLKQGVDIRKVSKFLGHKSVTITEKYYAPWNRAQQDILDNDIRLANQKMDTTTA